MSKTKLLSIAVIGLLIMNIAVVGFLLLRKPPKHGPEAPPMGHDGGPPGREGRPAKIIAERLQFNPEQVAAYEKLIADHQESLKAIKDSISITKNNLYRTLAGENSSGKDSLIAKLGLLQRQIELTHYQHFESLKKICRPEQFKYFDELTKELAVFFGPGKKDGPPPKD